MKLVVGLGNPGPRYASSRHNIGFRIVEELARDCGAVLDRERFLGRYGEGSLPGSPAPSAGAPEESLGLLEPSTFMNRSGRSVAAALAELSGIEPARDLLVVYDDLDLPVGRIRVRARGGAGGHRGVADIIDALGSRTFARLRFGIGRPRPGDSVVDFVLEPFAEDEESRVRCRIPTAALAILTALREGVVVAMDRFNGEDDSST